MSSSEKIIEIRDLSVDYDGRRVLRGVNAEVEKGDFVAITGPNGGGKSTLLKCILRLIVPAEGRVAYYEGGVPAERLRFGYLPQKSNIDSRFPITVEEVVASGLQAGKRSLFGRYTVEERQRIDEVMERMGVAGLRRQVLGTLSGGQLQRTLLGRAIISQPEIVVLDEPLSYVDRAFVEQIYDIVETLSKTSTILLVSHEMTVISEMANRLWIVDHALHECTAAHHYMKTECR